MRPSLTVVLTVVVVVAVVAATYGLMFGVGRRAGGLSSVAVVPKWTYDSIPGNQYDAVAFVTHSTSHINGTFTNTIGVIVYLMTPAQLVDLARTGTVGGYNWSSGVIPQLTLYGLNLTVTASSWDLVFLNPDPLNVTVVDFWSAVTLDAA
jgi:hypothetical protein